MKTRTFAAAACAFALTLGGCSDAKDERGLRYMPDMMDAPALKAQEARTVTTADGTVYEVPAMMAPVEGTLARDFVAYDIANTAEGLEQAKGLVNPLSPTVAVLKRGQDRFDIYCAVCHGKDGNVANSYVAGEGRVQGIVSISTPGVTAMPDGQIYHIMTHGRGRMPNYRAQLSADDRWSVIHYLRALTTAVSAKDAAAQDLEQRQRDGAAEQFRQPAPTVPEYEQGQWPSNIQREDAQ
ncbi:MAG: c-type cytochrome [Planctomycetota bacterium]|jgi:mono/diheme cytochrome c family protein